MKNQLSKGEHCASRGSLGVTVGDANALIWHHRRNYERSKRICKVIRRYALLAQVDWKSWDHGLESMENHKLNYKAFSLINKHLVWLNNGCRWPKAPKRHFQTLWHRCLGIRHILVTNWNEDITIDLDISSKGFLYIARWHFSSSAPCQDFSP